MRTGTLTGFQRAIIVVATILVALRLFAPVKYVPQTNLVSYVPGVWLGGSPEGGLIRTAIGITVFHVLALMILAAVICVLFPEPRWLTSEHDTKIARVTRVGVQIVLAAALAAGLFALVFYVLGMLFPERGSRAPLPQYASSSATEVLSLDEAAKARALWNGIQNCSVRIEKLNAEDRDLLARFLASAHSRVRRLPDPIASAFCDHSRSGAATNRR